MFAGFHKMLKRPYIIIDHTLSQAVAIGYGPSKIDPPIQTLTPSVPMVFKWVKALTVPISTVCPA